MAGLYKILFVIHNLLSKNKTKFYNTTNCEFIMSIASQNTILIEIPKPRRLSTKFIEKRSKKAKKDINNIASNSSEPEPQKCSLPEIKNVDFFKRAEILVPFKFYAREKEHEKHLKNISTSINERYKVKSMDLKKRRYVKNPQNDVQCITDTDKDYFTNIRNCTYKYALHYKSYKSDLNDRLRLKHEINFKKDYVLDIELKNRNEFNMYELALNEYKSEVKNLDHFVAENYEKTMACLNQSEDLYKLVNIKVKELLSLAEENCTIMSNLLNLDYMYGLQLKYGRFLYYLSPPTWRLENRQFARSIEIEAKGFDFGISNADDNFSIVYEKIKNNCVNNYTTPVLYFQEPTELMDVFGNIKKRQLHIFNYIFQLQPFIKILQDRVTELKQSVRSDTETLVSAIDKFNCLLLFDEERCSQSEKEFLKILNNSFYNDTVAIDVLKFQTSLEFCYEKIYSEKALNLDMVTIAKALESMYFDYCYRLDYIRTVKLRSGIAKCEEDEKKKLQRAYAASQELRIFGRLYKHLTRAFEPKFYSKNISLPPIVPKKQIKKNMKHKKQSVAEINRRSLTDAEHEYLCLFTDWAESEDPALYLKSHSFSQDQN